MSAKKIKAEILKKYLGAYKHLLAAEELNEDSVIISLPLHFSRNHRVEVAVTRVGDQFALSDMARTIGELKLSGYVISRTLKDRIKEIGHAANVDVKRHELVRMCQASEVGDAIQSFGEVVKTIGDAYLVHKQRPASEARIFGIVKNALDTTGISYESRTKVTGRQDEHNIDFYAPSNGKPGFALAVLARQDTHALAQIWDFKCRDLKQKYPKLRIGLIYDTEEARWSDTSHRILRHAADKIIPSTNARNAANFVK